MLNDGIVECNSNDTSYIWKLEIFVDAETMRGFDGACLAVIF